MDSEAAIGCLAIFAIVGFIGLVALLPAIRFSSLREGKHTGYVTAVEQSGWLFPNYNVYFKTDNSSSQEDTYCVNRNNRSLGEKLKALSAKRQLVTITFDGVRGIGYGLCSDVEIKDVSIDR